jgi:hypothetical protein
MAGKCGTFWNKLISDVDGGTSSKRFVTLIAFGLLAIAFLCNIFLNVKLEKFIWEGMLYLVLGGLGFTSLEKFTLSRDRKTQKQNKITHEYDYGDSDNEG